MEIAGSGGGGVGRGRNRPANALFLWCLVFLAAKLPQIYVIYLFIFWEGEGEVLASQLSKGKNPRTSNYFAEGEPRENI